MINASKGANLISERNAAISGPPSNSHLVRLTGDHQRATAINPTLPQHLLCRFP